MKKTHADYAAIISGYPEFSKVESPLILEICQAYDKLLNQNPSTYLTEDQQVDVQLLVQVARCQLAWIEDSKLTHEHRIEQIHLAINTLERICGVKAKP